MEFYLAYSKYGFETRPKQSAVFINMKTVFFENNWQVFSGTVQSTSKQSTILDDFIVTSRNKHDFFFK